MVERGIEEIIILTVKKRGKMGIGAHHGRNIERKKLIFV
tara:strand:- start:208 stop:324 length:117 start_codon:yes stop_codon:yes gene_type:complete